MASYDYVELVQTISPILGWFYVLCWSASFYPQPWLNWRQKSTDGLAIEFPVMNIVGFCCYTLSTGLFLFSRPIRDQYAQRHPSAPKPTVRLNDFAFALHGALLCSITLSQFMPKVWGFKNKKGSRLSAPALGILCGLAVGVTVLIVIVIRHGHERHTDARTWAWIDIVYALSYTKLMVTLIKYIPQVWNNYKRQSTTGWSIYQILLDYTGGVLSICQLVLDSWMQGDWSGVSGNAAKLVLGNVSILFDVIFIVQHYVLYTQNSIHETGSGSDRATTEDHVDEQTALLHARD